MIIHNSEADVAQWFLNHPTQRNVTHVVIHDDVYQYDYKMSWELETAARHVEPKPQMVEWYVNFADKALFGNYAKPFTFNTDEIITLEHPILFSVREAMLDLASDKMTFRERISKFGRYSFASMSEPELETLHHFNITKARERKQEKDFKAEEQRNAEEQTRGQHVDEESNIGGGSPHVTWDDTSLRSRQSSSGFYGKLEEYFRKKSPLEDEQTPDPFVTENIQPLCTDVANRCTPILTIGAERKCDVGALKLRRFKAPKKPTDPVVHPSDNDIKDGLTVWPAGEGHLTNFISMEAMDQAVYERTGPYLLRELRHYLRTALTSFTAAVAASGSSKDKRRGSLASHGTIMQQRKVDSPVPAAHSIDDEQPGRPSMTPSADTLVDEPDRISTPGSVMHPPEPSPGIRPFTVIHTGYVMLVTFHSSCG
ncbi:hypothetical protein HDV00_004563 [Rhizophlyctis rosea]|nr:hypothetical protein HDV00_004563 [Rhizophlyctis rosea]